MTNAPASLALLAAAETSRLCLRALLPEDAPALQALTDDRRIVDAISFLQRPFTRADADALIALRAGGSDCFIGIRERGTDRLIGVVGAHLRDPADIEIGYWIAAACQGRGYATEATGAMLLLLRALLPQRRILAECRPDNLASWRVLAKLGFRPTGAHGRRPGRLLLALAPG